MDDPHGVALWHAVVLAAGNGDRFRGTTAHSKLLARVAGIPLLTRTLESAWRAGVTDAHVVLGYDADAVRALAVATAPPSLRLHFHLNHRWHDENGLSVLAAREPLAGRRFALMMGDHVFEPRVLARLLRITTRKDEALLCVDFHCDDPQTVLEATRVRVKDDRISAIGKGLEPYDALDTGLFLCQASIFDALGDAYASGDTTLSGGVRRLADQGLVRAVDIGLTRWCDIDTVADLRSAEQAIRHTAAR
jgi:choline kinase